MWKIDWHPVCSLLLCPTSHLVSYNASLGSFLSRRSISAHSRAAKSSWSGLSDAARTHSMILLKHLFPQPHAIARDCGRRNTLVNCAQSPPPPPWTDLDFRPLHMPLPASWPPAPAPTHILWQMLPRPMLPGYRRSRRPCSPQCQCVSKLISPTGTGRQRGHIATSRPTVTTVAWYCPGLTLERDQALAPAVREPRRM
jgi:hypothetical protein